MNWQELYREAQRTVERRRQLAEMDAARRRTELEQALPELEQIERQRDEAGAAAARLAALGEKQAAEEKLFQMQQAAAQKEALLKEAGVDSERLAPRYTCKVCNDMGYTAGAACECVHREVRRLRRSEINQSSPLTVSSFDTFDVNRYPEWSQELGYSPRFAMGEVLRESREYVEAFGPKSLSLYMYGSAGLGKTHLALAIAGGVLEKGFDVIYVSAQKAFAQMSAERWENGGRSPLLLSMLEADLLILDDLGTEFLDAYVLSRLYELVNSRMNARPTIYTSNITRHDLLNQRYTEKIASRLLGECHSIHFVGEDIRLSKGTGA